MLAIENCCDEYLDENVGASANDTARNGVNYYSVTEMNIEKTITHNHCPPSTEFDDFFSSTIMLAFAASGEIILVSVVNQAVMQPNR